MDGDGDGLQVAVAVVDAGVLSGHAAVARHAVLGRHAAGARRRVRAAVEGRELVQARQRAAVDGDRLVLVVVDDDAVLHGALQRVESRTRRRAARADAAGSDDRHRTFVAPPPAPAREQHAHDDARDQQDEGERERGADHVRARPGRRRRRRRRTGSRHGDAAAGREMRARHEVRATHDPHARHIRRRLSQAVHRRLFLGDGEGFCLVSGIVAETVARDDDPGGTRQTGSSPPDTRRHVGAAVEFYLHFAVDGAALVISPHRWRGSRLARRRRRRHCRSCSRRCCCRCRCSCCRTRRRRRRDGERDGFESRDVSAVLVAQEREVAVLVDADRSAICRRAADGAHEQNAAVHQPVLEALRAARALDMVVCDVQLRQRVQGLQIESHDVSSSMIERVYTF